MNQELVGQEQVIEEIYAEELFLDPSLHSKTLEIDEEVFTKLHNILIAISLQRPD